MATTRFAIGLQRLIPWFGYHHVLMMLVATSIILLSISIAGCSSYSAMTNVSVLELFYNNGTVPSSNTQANTNLSASLQGIKGVSRISIRAGYFGSCVRTVGVSWLCSSSGAALLEQFGPAQDPLNIIWIATRFQNDVLFTGLIFLSIALAFVALCLLATFPGWHYEHDPETGSDIDVKPFPSRPVAQLVLISSFSSAIFTLVATLWQHTAAIAMASTIRSAYYGNLSVSIGAVSLVLMWTSTTLLITATIGMLVMLLSMSVLDKLTGEGGDSPTFFTPRGRIQVVP